MRTWQRILGVVVVLGVLGLFLTITCVKGHPLSPSQEGGPALSAGVVRRIRPGTSVTFTHILTNTGEVSRSFAISATSSSPWPLDIGIGDLPEWPLTIPASMTLGPMMTETAYVRLHVPDDVYSGTVAQTILAATALGTGLYPSRAVATDTAVIYRVPGVALSPGHVHEVWPGDLVTLTHCVTNTGPLTDTFVVQAWITPAGALSLQWLDVPSQTLRLPVTLGELQAKCFIVQVQLPRTTPIVAMSEASIVISATSLTDETVWDVVTETLRIGPVSQTFLPLVMHKTLPAVQLGMDFGFLVTRTDVITRGFPMVKSMGADWVRVFLGWYNIERAPGEYTWDDYDAVFDGLRASDLKGLVVIYGAPAWAAEESCGPISDTLLLEAFLDELVPRYADVVSAWEFINEPDGGEPHRYGPVIGCWGKDPDLYAQQLAIFYAKIRALSPGSLVFFGGLAYDAWEAENFQRDFFEKSLQNGAGAFFDGLSFHYYPINLVDFPTMAHKVGELREIMTRNGVYDKRIWVTETGMWVNDIGVPELAGSVEKQRNFIAKEFARGLGAGADNIFWFDPLEYNVPEGFVKRWLIDQNYQPVNGYSTFVTYAEKIDGLHCSGRYTTSLPTYVEAYEFIGQGRRLYILWSSAETAAIEMAATTPVILTDRDGETSIQLLPDNGRISFEVDSKPVFLTFP